MGGQIRGGPEASPLTGETPTGGASIGVYLARERRLRGISLDELADLTKIPRRSLERLEAGAFDRNPDGFARGFVRTVALALGLSAEEAVMRMMGEPLDAGEAAAYSRMRAARWLLVTAALFAGAAGLAAVFWGWHTASLSAATFKEPPAIVYRRDPVRSLAEAQARSKALEGGAADRPDSVGSAGGENSHPGADSSQRRLR